MQSEKFTIFVVEDNPSIRDALSLLLGLHGYAVAMFADAESFLRTPAPQRSGCLLLDIRMPGMNGLELQRHLCESGSLLPIILMTGHGDLESARQAFRANAIDFLEKPIDQGRLLGAIREAQQRYALLRERTNEESDALKRISALTPREREVMDMVVAGVHNREIASILGISVRTVEVHKARMLDKLGVDGIPQLVRLVITMGQLQH